ncbi:hypothetical protein SDC9_159679 [bioreactor metagenome]|uniref:Uncharacterized protein n=1 Tax=bioreactor metagenome TaxID=1076179 RepID=A0A645FDB9_9ZZZZ
MTEVKIGFRAVVGDENFAVLIWAHRSRIDVYVRIKLLRGDLKPSGF